MLLKPCNRYFLVEPLEEDEIEETSILLPDDYKKQNPFGVALIINRAVDCSVEAHAGDTIVYSTNMLESVSIGGKEFFLLLENYVLGTIHEKT
jgi:co-chaperonin GroES (HSP10)|tara:strand:- start:218 stop:496 length:279 start_codon:yes stop_codon:yes gene_type:complete